MFPLTVFVLAGKQTKPNNKLSVQDQVCL